MLHSFLQNIRTSYIEEVTFYRKFHQNPINCYIHAVFVPIEWCSFLLITCYLNLQWHISTSIAIYYMCIGSFISVLSGFCHILIAIIATLIFSMNLSISITAILVIFVQMISWYIQVYIGHGIYEKSSPALTVRLTFNSIILSILLSWDQIDG